MAKKREHKYGWLIKITHQKTKFPKTPDNDIWASDASSWTTFNILGSICDNFSSKPLKPPTAFNETTNKTILITNIGKPCTKSVHATDLKPPTIT